MKALIYSKRDNNFYFERNVQGKLSLCRTKGLNPMSQNDLCLTQRDEKVKVYVMEYAPTGTYPYDKQKGRLDTDAFYAMQVYAIKAPLVGIALEFDERHTAERDYTFKLLGIMEREIYFKGGMHG